MEKEKTFCALAAGFILFTASFFLLFINEFNYANTLQIANFVEKNAIQVSSKNINPSNENKAVYMTGKVSSQQTLTDSIISIPSAIALFRDTEMYQWEEIKQHKSSQKSSYEYRKIWSKKLIDSDKFKNNTYNNPKKMKYKAENFYADNVSLGDFYLSNEITEKINSITKITQLPYNPELKIYNGFYFTGTNYDTPSIGDQKLSYSYIPSEIQVSVIARQTGNRLESIDNKYGSLVIIMNGEKSLQTMLNEYRKNNSENTCIFRGIGIILIFISLNLLIQPIITKDKSIPFLGLHTKMSALISTIIITLALSTITISIGWFLFRPERAIPLIIISILTILSLKKRKKVIIPE